MVRAIAIVKSCKVFIKAHQIVQQSTQAHTKNTIYLKCGYVLLKHVIINVALQMTN